jgi:DNA invertase Pin-like site-specific DNA recombinase
MTEEITEPAVYARRSTEDQEEEHQINDVKSWLEYKDLDWSDAEIYSETASGASGDREEFRSLIQSIESGYVDDVVVWEISRIARNGLLAQEFFEACEENSVTVHVTNGAVRKVEPDGHGRLVADIVAAVAAEERRRLIQRTKSGQRRARDNGKWIGNPPKGFIVSDGHLKPNLDPDYEEGETGFFDMVNAMEDIQSGKSYRQTAKDTKNVDRATLSDIYQDEDRCSWYLDGEAQDARVEDALDEVNVDASD